MWGQLGHLDCEEAEEKGECVCVRREREKERRRERRDERRDGN